MAFLPPTVKVNYSTTARTLSRTLAERTQKNIKDVKIEKVFNKNASWEHEYWKYRIGMYYRKKGFDVTYEYRIGEGKSVDVVAEKDGRKIAIEMETGKSDYLYNIKKNLDYGFDEIIVAALNKATRERIVSELKDAGQGKEKRIEVVEVSGFLNCGHV
jgi:hypothetical protein